MEKNQVVGENSLDHIKEDEDDEEGLLPEPFAEKKDNTHFVESKTSHPANHEKIEYTVGFGKIFHISMHHSSDAEKFTFEFQNPNQFTVTKEPNIAEKSSISNDDLKIVQKLTYSAEGDKYVILEGRNTGNILTDIKKLKEMTYDVNQNGEISYGKKGETLCFSLWAFIFRGQDGSADQIQVKVMEYWKEECEQRFLQITKIDQDSNSTIDINNKSADTVVKNIFLFSARGCIKENIAILCQCDTQKQSECGCYEMTIGTELTNDYSPGIFAEILPRTAEHPEKPAIAGKPKKEQPIVQTDLERVSLGNETLALDKKGLGLQFDDKFESGVFWSSKLDTLIQ